MPPFPSFLPHFLTSPDNRDSPLREDLELVPPRCIKTDNGAELQSRFHWHVADQGIEHVYIRPKTPRLNGKVERFHRIDEEEFYRLLEGDIIDDAKIFNDKLTEWEDYYNFDRPHGALNGQTPYERLRQKTTTPT